MADPPLQSLEYVEDHHSLDTKTHAEIVRLLDLQWKPQAIAQTLDISKKTVTALKRKLKRHASRPVLTEDIHRGKGRPSKLSVADEDALFHWLKKVGWHDQHVMVKFFRYERGREVSQSKISRLIKQKGWNREQFRQEPIAQNEDIEPPTPMPPEINNLETDSSSAPLEDLAFTITKNASLVTNFLRENNHTQPSFSPYGPSKFPAEAPDSILSARRELIAAARQLHFLALGPTEALQWYTLTGVRLSQLRRRSRKNNSIASTSDKITHVIFLSTNMFLI